MEGKQQQFKLGGKLVFTALAGDFHTEREPLALENALENCPGDFLLVRTQPIYQ